jgi:hypothetical protein
LTKTGQTGFPNRSDRFRPDRQDKQPAGQTPNFSRPISRITPRIAAKLRDELGYLLGNLYLKGIDPKRSQSIGIEEIASLGQELTQLEKTTKSSLIQRRFGGKVIS